MSAPGAFGAGPAGARATSPLLPRQLSHNPTKRCVQNCIATIPKSHSFSSIASLLSLLVVMLTGTSCIDYCEELGSLPTSTTTGLAAIVLVEFMYSLILFTALYAGVTLKIWCLQKDDSIPVHIRVHIFCTFQWAVLALPTAVNQDEATEHLNTAKTNLMKIAKYVQKKCLEIEL